MGRLGGGAKHPSGGCNCPPCFNVATCLLRTVLNRLTATRRIDVGAAGTPSPPRPPPAAVRRFDRRTTVNGVDSP